MKNVMKLLSILLLASVVFTSCGDKKNTVDIPTNLSVTDITDVSAKLMWSGSADSYEIMLSSQLATNPPFSSTTTSLVLSNLTANTAYTWKIRAKKGDNYSEWVAGTAFTTTAPPTPPPSEVIVQFGTATWTAALAGAIDRGAHLNLRAFKVNNSTLPFIDFLINKTGTTTFTFPNYYTEGILWGEYWENEAQLMQDSAGNMYGDWFAYSGSVIVTSNTGSTISGTAELQMFNAYQAVVLMTTPEMRILKITFNNVSILSSSSSPQKSLAVKRDFFQFEKKFAIVKLFKK